MASGRGAGAGGAGATASAGGNSASGSAGCSVRRLKSLRTTSTTVVDSALSRAADFNVVIGVCMILLMMPRVSDFDRHLLLGRERSEAAAHAVQLGLAQILQVLLQADDGGNNFSGLGTLLELAHLFIDDQFGASRFLVPISQMRLHHLLQIVDVVDEDSVEVVETGIDVTRYGDVDEEHGPILPDVEELLAVLLAEDGVRRAGGADDDVGPGRGVIEAIKGNGFAVKLLGQGDGAVEGAVADVNLFGPVGDEVTGREFAHLAGAHQIHRLAGEAAEDLLRQFDGHRCDGNRRGSDGGLIPNLFGDGKGAGQKLVKLRIYRTEGAGGGVGFLHLSEDLRLADHHGIQAGGDAEDVLDGLKLLVLEDVGFELAGTEAEEVAHKLLQIAIAVLRARKDFHPVAGGDDHALLDTTDRGELTERLRQTRVGNGESLSHFHRRRLVIYTQYKKIHGAMNLCSLLK